MIDTVLNLGPKNNDIMIADVVKILLVDDRKENLLSLSRALANENYHFVEATSGHDALNILMKEHDFAIILMEVQMDVLNGFEIAGLIRQNEKLKYIPIIFLAEDSNAPDNIFKGYRVGAVDYILKPFNLSILKAKVEVFVDLYKKNRELIVQSESLKTLNKELEKRSVDLLRNVQELEKFAYVASHDLQEPLRTITSYIQLLQRKYKDKLDEEGNEFMEYIVGGSRRMKALINDLLEYSRVNKDESELKPVDCNDILAIVMQNMSDAIKDNKVIIQYEKLPVIMASGTQMVQLFQNLIGNAIKFKSDKDPVIKISAQKKNGFYLFAVEDNGIGIKKEYFTKIFEIFQRLHSMQQYPGTGIGLAICMKIIQRFGGQIWIDSEYGKGSTFYFTIKDSM